MTTLPCSRVVLSRLLALSLLALSVALPAAAIDTNDTRLLADPSPSSDHVVFLYAGDVWIANIDGSSPRRLTTHPGHERAPRLSPDGRWVAFSGQYDGNVDVYVVPATGGEPRRLTWHPANDRVTGFTPDSSRVLFSSPRDDYSGRYRQAFTVSIEGGFPEKMPVPRAFGGALSEDGKKIAYNPTNDRFLQWKNYRGGTASRIWIQDLADHSVVEIPQPEGRCNDTDAMWLGGKFYFRSDRDGEFNLYTFDADAGTVTRLTEHEDFPIIHAAAGGGRIAYEQAGYVHLYDPASGASNRLQIGIATDLMSRRPRWEQGPQNLRSFSLSPSGKRVALGYRGDIVTVPAKKGSIRPVTATSDAHERHPVWSPDGEKIAYFSDASGEYELHVKSQDGQGEAKSYKLDGAGFYDLPKFSPDGEKISFVDNSWSLYILNLEDGNVKKVHSEILFGPIRTLHHDWAPDSRWLAYTAITPTYFQRVMLYSLDEDESYEVTDGMADVSEPVFDPSGKYLYFAASTDAGPIRQWFAQSSSDVSGTNALYLAVLQKDEPSPFDAESDEEGDGGDDEEGDEDEESSEGEEDEGDDDDSLRIDLDGLKDRIVPLPLQPADYGQLAVGEEYELHYVRQPPRERMTGLVGLVGELAAYDVEDREETSIAQNVDAYVLSADGEMVLARSGGRWLLGESEEKLDAGEHAFSADKVRVFIDPVAEWEQIYDEAWRINRDMFYDPGMHGADWPAMREKYRQFLPHLAHRDDLNRVLQWLHSELAAGHHRVGGGDMFYDVERIQGGLLGADYEIADGKYRFKKVYGGLNWNPGLRAPLTEPGVNVKAGEYLLAVNGKPLDGTENVHSRFEATAGKIVDIEVGPNADGTDSRQVQVVPIDDEENLRNRAWVEANIKKVHEATNGRVGYVWLPNTAIPGFIEFKRYFYPQAHLDGMIVDERFNGGGLLADYYVDLLRRPVSAYWAMRYGADLKTPIASIQGPKALLIDETAGSGGDFFPWMFRKLNLGPLIGKRTWGGLVGVLGFPPLLDGGNISAPNIAFWAPEEGYGIENVGVPPDIDVEMWPAEVNAGKDPQLERAIQHVLGELEKNPPKKPQRPPFPIRVRR